MEEDDLENNEQVDEDIRKEPVEGLVGPNYETEDELVVVGEADSKNVNLDFGFGVLDGQDVREFDIDYSDSKELRSLYSKDKEGTTSRKRTMWMLSIPGLTQMS
ncbi:hypothetical protein Adt_03272 [Abeliophyllum distichum]|uniref:Uncharacterized protein n=1 Tax=Abeliophyllum distichum TaxID=126358 RepID=A0ABD1VY11_9LAMI